MNRSSNDIEDFKWLASEEATAWFARLASAEVDAIKWTKALRKSGLSIERSRLIVDQLTLRPLARKKFSQADRMFFDRQLLEQATDERLAQFKARRFEAAPAIVDFCCGIGGDLLTLAKQNEAIGVDSNWRSVALANLNAAACNISATAVESLAEDFELSQFEFDLDAWFHIDPDRRASGSRTTSLEAFSPSLEFLTQLVGRHSHGAIKLAPATKVPDTWNNAERMWIGDRHECKQQVVWLGETIRDAGCKTAAAIDQDGAILFEWSAKEKSYEEFLEFSRPMAAIPGPFLYEPHPTIIAGRMVDALAIETNLNRLVSDVQYLVGDETDHPALTRFRVLETTRLDVRSVKERLAALDCGSLEIKKRGVDHQLMAPFAKLKWDGQQPLVLFLTRHGSQHVALIATRMP